MGFLPGITVTTVYAPPTLSTVTPAIEANAALFTSACRAAVMAVVKADGYGLGAEHLAQAALNAGCTWLGTTDVAAAARLRMGGFSVPILSWLHPAGLDLQTAEEQTIDVAIGSREQLIQALCYGRGNLRLHLHVDTGMARGGLPDYDWHEFMALAAEGQQEGKFTVVGLMGHLPNADTVDPAANDAGISAFEAAHQIARKVGLSFQVRHLATTAASLNDKRTHYDLVRVGAGLAGIDPSGSTELHPTARLTCAVLHTRKVESLTTVGYGGRGIVNEAGHLSVLGIGYADGLPQYPAPEAHVVIEGRPCRIVGSVNMDQVVVETGEIEFRPGTEATVIGTEPGEPTVNRWATWGGASANSIITGFGPRLHRTVTIN